jgi:hypothetical protein
MRMNRENLIGRDDELVKAFNDLYASAKLTSALTRTSLRHAYLEGIHEDRIAWFHRATAEVAQEAVSKWDDTDIRRFLGRD